MTKHALSVCLRLCAAPHLGVPYSSVQNVNPPTCSIVVFLDDVCLRHVDILEEAGKLVSLACSLRIQISIPMTCHFVVHLRRILASQWLLVQPCQRKELVMMSSK